MSEAIDTTVKTNAYNGLMLTVEFANKTCNNVICPITRRTYRGRWDSAAMKNRTAEDRFVNMPDLPGVKIIFDGSNRKVTIHDPLSERDNLRTLRTAQEVFKMMNWPAPTPSRDIVYERQKDSELKNWLYWIRRWLDSGVIRQESGGEIPSMDRIEKLPGKVRYHVWDTSPQVNRYPEELPAPYMSPADAAGLQPKE